MEVGLVKCTICQMLATFFFSLILDYSLHHPGLLCWIIDYDLLDWFLNLSALGHELDASNEGRKL